MTVEEIRKIINTNCCGRTCGTCPLWDCDYDCGRIDDEDCTQEEAERLYSIMCPSIVTKGISDNPVTHPSHYTQGNIQCIDAMESAFGKEAVATWCKLNSFKYIWREEHKNGLQDIDKAIWYLNKYKELKASGE